MRVCVIGTGYVGLVAGACFASVPGNKVTCVDINEGKIALLNSGNIPIYEPGLDTLVKSGTSSESLFFTTDVASALSEAEVAFIAVGTPPLPDGSADLSHVYNVAKTVAIKAPGSCIIVNKSTVPVGTSDIVKSILKGFAPHKTFSVVSNPEFLREGVALDDFLHPERVVIGTEDARAKEVMSELYSPFSDTVIFMSNKSAEVTKYASNAMLATRISFMNEISRLCSVVGASVEDVRLGMSKDVRIGKKFLHPGVGYGGSCFPKDVKAIIATAQEFGTSLSILEAVEEVNKSQKRYLTGEVKKLFGNDLSGKVFTIFGLSFKPKTDDVRECPAAIIVRGLLDAGANVRLHDPVAVSTFSVLFPESGSVSYFSDKYEAAKGSDAVLLVTEWSDYLTILFDVLRDNMRGNVIYDGRNAWNPEEVRSFGFCYYDIGRTPRDHKNT